MASAANFTSGPDPRINEADAPELAAHPAPAVPTYVRPQHRKQHDPSVTFEEYHYYANLARAEEDAKAPKDIGDKGILSLILPSKSLKGDVVQTLLPATESGNEKTGVPSNGERNGERNGDKNLHDLEAEHSVTISDDEWTNASRAMRTATWAAVFYLITTDILGPFSVP